MSEAPPGPPPPKKSDLSETRFPPLPRPGARFGKLQFVLAMGRGASSTSNSAYEGGVGRGRKQFPRVPPPPTHVSMTCRKTAKPPSLPTTIAGYFFCDTLERGRKKNLLRRLPAQPARSCWWFFLFRRTFISPKISAKC